MSNQLLMRKHVNYIPVVYLNGTITHQLIDFASAFPQIAIH